MTESAGTLPFVQIFTDGACRGNPGPGGWACILRHPASGSEKEFSGGHRETTNNQMELQAVIEGLQKLTRRTRVEVITDSKYVAQGCESWMAGWKKNGWQRREGRKLKPVANVDFWKKLDTLLAQHDVRFNRRKGTCGTPGKRTLR